MLPLFSWVVQGLKDTTKARDGRQRMPLMDGIGSASFVDDVTFLEIRSAASVLRTIAEANTFAINGKPQGAISSVVPKPPTLAPASLPVAV